MRQGPLGQWFQSDAATDPTQTVN